MKILVKYNNSHYYWVDTVVMHDEYDYICAVLVSNNGGVFAICIDKIEVVGDDYAYEKNVQKRIDMLKQENFSLQEKMRLDAQLSQLHKCRQVIKEEFGIEVE